MEVRIMSEFEDDMRALVARERGAITERMQYLVEWFRDTHAQVRKTLPPSKRGSLDLRMQIRKGVPRVEWSELSFTRPRAKGEPRSQHFGRGGRFHYARGRIRRFVVDPTTSPEGVS
jgi:hypothetical protein